MYNDGIALELNKCINDNELLHSYIFSGINGIGKKDVAFSFARNIICNNDISKKKFDSQNHPDFTYIKPDDKNTIKIEVIRQLVKDVNIKPIESKYKVYIIEDADKITTQGQNSLLKTLEEPPEYVVIILITSNYYGLIDTIRSRSQNIEFSKLRDLEILEYIKKNNIDINIDEELLLFLINGRIKYINLIEKDIDKIKSILKFIEKNR